MARDELEKRSKTIRDNYTNFFSAQQLLKNGKSYEEFYPSSKGDQFLIAGGTQKADIIFQNVAFNDIDLNYDIYNDLVLTSYVQKNGLTKLVILDTDKVTKFRLGQSDFININLNFNKSLEEGIYQLAFDGKKSILLVKRKKELINTITPTAGEARYKFIRADRHFIIKNAETAFVKSKKELMAIFQDDDRMKSFIKRQKIKFKNDDEDIMAKLVRILTYYEHL
ncbi:hypothetical protein QQ008_03525 [Fulvivirgaceae bacterium BMA10]|uniref:Uncharacterized protein n=2 Tax=Splendidivirga corallicola TaxID=3051826 RepID=A0ABT8KJG7_9BACT|nr:hypothetical protein [Fulvivirgaceae bacterium BMA10]